MSPTQRIIVRKANKLKYAKNLEIQVHTLHDDPIVKKALEMNPEVARGVLKELQSTMRERAAEVRLPGVDPADLGKSDAALRLERLRKQIQELTQPPEVIGGPADVKPLSDAFLMPGS